MMRCLVQKRLDDVSAVVHDVETLGQKVVLLALGRVDLDTSKDGDLSVGNISGTLGENLTHKIVLGLVKGVGKLHHVVLSSLKFLGEREEHVADKSLLSVDGISSKLRGRGLSLEYTSDVATGGDGRSAAGTTVGTAATLDGSNVALRVNTDVGSKADQARSYIRDVSSHGSEGGNATEGESAKVRTKADTC